MKGLIEQESSRLINAVFIHFGDTNEHAAH